MAIYTRWGESVTIEQNCGQHESQLGGGKHKVTTTVTLVKVKFEDGDERYAIAESLKADEGWTEIEAAVAEASKVTLEAAELKRALREAV